MNTEIEVKFLDINHEEIRAKLKGVGAILDQPMRLMRRVTIETTELKSKNAFIRIRDEGNKTTVTYKQFNELSVDGAKEIEIEINDFEKAMLLFSEAGLPFMSFQESKRESWKLGNTEIVLDIWPYLNPYIEIEGESEDALRTLSDQLGLDWKDAVFGDVMAAYRSQYPHLDIHDTVASIPEFKFDDPLPELLKN